MTTTDAATARSVTITVPMTPSPALSPNARRRGNVWAQREATEELRTAAKYSAVSYLVFDGPLYRAGFPLQLVTIHEHIIWPKSKGVLPDPDGIPTLVKAALDGIVDAGIIAGDSAQHIAQITASQEKGTDRQGCIVITISEAI